MPVWHRRARQIHTSISLICFVDLFFPVDALTAPTDINLDAENSRSNKRNVQFAWFERYTEARAPGKMPQTAFCL